MLGWKSRHKCRYCASLEVIPIIDPSTPSSLAETSWDCQSCDIAWETFIDESEAIWQTERKRYEEATSSQQLQKMS